MMEKQASKSLSEMTPNERSRYLARRIGLGSLLASSLNQFGHGHTLPMAVQAGILSGTLGAGIGGLSGQLGGKRWKKSTEKYSDIGGQLGGQLGATLGFLRAIREGNANIPQTLAKGFAGGISGYTTDAGIGAILGGLFGPKDEKKSTRQA